MGKKQHLNINIVKQEILIVGDKSKNCEIMEAVWQNCADYIVVCMEYEVWSMNLAHERKVQ